MALNFPETVSTAFLLHSIPLHGDIFDDGEKEVVMEIDTEEGLEEVEGLVTEKFPDDMKSDKVLEYLKSFSDNPDKFPATDHKMSRLMYDAAKKMPGKAAALIANSRYVQKFLL